MRLGPAAILLVVSLGPLSLLAGCAQSCNQACVMRAQMIDNCLEPWGYAGNWSWTGYDSAETWLAVCQVEYSEAIKYATIENQRAIRDYCSHDIADMWASNNCSDFEPNFSLAGTITEGTPGTGAANAAPFIPEPPETAE